jgi:hypothetical protein
MSHGVGAVTRWYMVPVGEANPIAPQPPRPAGRGSEASSRPHTCAVRSPAPLGRPPWVCHSIRRIRTQTQWWLTGVPGITPHRTAKGPTRSNVSSCRYILRRMHALGKVSWSRLQESTVVYGKRFQIHFAVYARHDLAQSINLRIA